MYANAIEGEHTVELTVVGGEQSAPGARFGVEAPTERRVTPFAVAARSGPVGPLLGMPEITESAGQSVFFAVR